MPRRRQRRARSTGRSRRFATRWSGEGLRSGDRGYVPRRSIEMEAAMNGPRNLLFIGTLALAAALLATTSLTTTYAAEATPKAGASGGAPSSDDLDAILKQTQGPA